MKVCNNTKETPFTVVFCPTPQKEIKKDLAPGVRVLAEEVLEQAGEAVPRYLKVRVYQKGSCLLDRDIEINTYIGLIRTREKKAQVHVYFEEDHSLEARTPTADMIQNVKDAIESHDKQNSQFVAPGESYTLEKNLNAVVIGCYHDYLLKLMRPEQLETAFNQIMAEKRRAKDETSGKRPKAE